MKLISAKERRTQPTQSTQTYSMLDSAEMEFTLQELGAAPSTRLTQTLMSPDLLTEYASCASMIMDREERESVARQLLNALQHHPIAA
jgi:hypothetical protein